MKAFEFVRTPAGVRAAVDALKADPDFKAKFDESSRTLQHHLVGWDVHVFIMAHAAWAELQLGHAVPTPGLELRPDSSWLIVLCEIAGAACSRVRDLGVLEP